MPEEAFYTPAGIQLYSRDTIFSKLKWLVQKDGVNVKDYSENFHLLFQVSNLCYDMLASQRSELLSRNPRTAEGLHLDDVVIDKGIVREQATQAFVVVELEFNDPKEVQVGAGAIKLEHSLGQSMSNIPFSQTIESKQRVTFMVDSPGTEGNLPILEDPELTIVLGDGINRAEQVVAGVGGNDPEGDIHLRARYYGLKQDPYSIANITRGLKEVDGVIDARFYYNNDPENTIQDVLPTHLGIAITTKGTYDDKPDEDWSEEVKRSIWSFLINNLDIGMITSKEDAFEIRYNHITSSIGYYIRPLRYVTTTSVKVYLKGVFPRSDIFADTLVKEEMQRLGVAIRNYIKDNITSDLKTFDITTIIHDEFKEIDLYKSLPSFIKESKVIFEPIGDGELGGEINISSKKAELSGGTYEKEIAYDKQEEPHVEVILNEVS